MPVNSKNCIADSILNRIVEEAGIQSQGPFIVSDKGYSSNCFFTKTPEGDICIRVYFKGFEVDQVKMEVMSLIYFSEKYIPVPKIIKLRNGSYFFNDDDLIAFCYYCIPGRTISQRELTPEISQQAGEMLSKMLTYSLGYSEATIPRNDYEEVHKLFRNQSSRLASLLNVKTVLAFDDFFKRANHACYFSNLDEGLVHGDFYYDNVIFNNGVISGVIDFGDAYIGHPFTDIVIGSMEFSTTADQFIDKACMLSFLLPFKNYLRQQGIKAEFFYDTIILNCIMFSILTIGTDNENDYVLRFHNFIEEKQKNTIIDIINNVLEV
ncbi:hypothetical protein CUU56_04215 [Pectobacterium parvum]|nr:hypothetical protein [Pectobacterium parvum]